MNRTVILISMILFIVVLEIITLYLLSRKLTQNLYTAVFLLTKSRPIAISFLSILFFPGTVIHELAHLFTAEILGVRTSGLTLVPEGIEQKEVRTGSVSIAQSDPIRRAIIGIAPVIWGLIGLGTLSYFLSQILFPAIPLPPGAIASPPPPGFIDIIPRLSSLTQLQWIILALLFYAVFAVSNTMFSSPEDLEGFWPVVIVITLVSVAMYVAGIRVTLTEPVISNVALFFQSVAVNLGYVTGLNIGLFFLSRLLIIGVERVTKRSAAQ